MSDKFVLSRRGLRANLSGLKLCGLALAALALTGCAGDHSPDIYAANAVQQANKVETGVVVGFRQVAISASGTVGAVSGGAAGGILGGAKAGSVGVDAALGAVAGTAIGGILGNTIERMAGDTTGWEYLVRKPDGGMVSVAQREPKPLPIGQKVLVINGAQARIVPDYSVAVDDNKDGKGDAKPDQTKKTEEPAAPPSAVTAAPPSAVTAAPPSAVIAAPPSAVIAAPPPAITAAPVQLSPLVAPIQSAIPGAATSGTAVPAHAPGGDLPPTI